LGLCIAAPSLRASISFTGGAGQGSTGNSLSFSGTGLNVTAYAFSTTGNSNTTLAQAALGQYSFGLGICNSNEFQGSDGCSATSPQWEHSISNEPDVVNGVTVTNYDFVLLQFSVPLTSIQLTLSPFGQTVGMDATYFTGNCTGTCTPSNFLTNIVSKADTTAGLSTITGVTGVTTGSYTGCASKCSTDQTFTITPTGGVNWLLIGANTAANYGGDGIWDTFKLESMGYATAPEPATFGLAAAALAAIGLLRRKKLLAAV